MTKQTIFESGERILIDKFHQALGLNSVEISYNLDGTIDTVEDLETGTIYTITYNSDGTINTIEDDDNTWTLSYNTDGSLSGVTRT